jgi:hypothetical protein
VPNNFDRYLDLVLCNKDCAVFKAVDVLLSADLYHPSLLMNLSLNVSTVKSFKRWNFRKADFHMLHKKIASTEWSFLEDCTNIDIACSLFYNKFNNLLDTCVPKTYSGYNGCYQPWFNSSIIKNIKRKWQIWRQYKINNNPVTCQIFKTIRSQIISIRFILTVLKVALELTQKNFGLTLIASKTLRVFQVACHI